MKDTTAIGTSTHIYFNKGQLKSLEQVGKMVRKNGGKYFRTLEDVAEYLNA